MQELPPQRPSIIGIIIMTGDARISGSAAQQIAAVLSRPDPIATREFLKPLLIFCAGYLSSSIPLQLVTALSEQHQRSDRPHGSSAVGRQGKEVLGK